MITLEMVKTAARRFYEAGKLTAQHPDPSQRECVYVLQTNMNYRCAFGACFSPPMVDHLGGVTGNINNLVTDFHLNIEDVEATSEIQQAHDTWAQFGREDTIHQTHTTAEEKIDWLKRMQEAELKFVKLIYS